MIKSFKHRGLKKFFEKGDKRGIQPKHESKLRTILQFMDLADSTEDFKKVLRFELHELKGKREGNYAVSVNGNWRVTFDFIEGHAYVVNYEDYH